MDANCICENVLSFIKNYVLNFKIIETAFSANITIKKTLLKNKSGEVKSRCRTQTPSYDSNISFKNTKKQAPSFQPKNTSLDITNKPLIHTSLPMNNTSLPLVYTTDMTLSEPSNLKQVSISNLPMNIISTLPRNPVTNLTMALSNQQFQLSKHPSPSLSEKTNLNLNRKRSQKTSPTSKQASRYKHQSCS